MLKVISQSKSLLSKCLVYRNISQSALLFDEKFDENKSTDYNEPCHIPQVPTQLKRNISEPVHISGYPSKPQVAWLETLKCKEDKKLGLIDLNPDIFGTFPRLDVIYQNLVWQGKYRFVDFRKIQTLWEVKRTGKKMYPQKGTGRARHGDRTAPQFIGGGQVKGPYGPYSFFNLLNRGVKIVGLTSSLTVKFVQDDLHVVDDFNLPSDNKEYLEDLIQSRNWGNSVLFINDTDVAPRNIASICQKIPHYLVIPVYSINVWSLIKYDTVVITLPALEILEEKLVANYLNPDKRNESVNNRYSNYLVTLKKTWEDKQYTNYHGRPSSHDDYLKYE